MKKHIKKILLFSTLLILSIVGLVQYPHLFIQKIGEYESFEIYSNEDIKIDESVKNILDSVSVNLNKSQFVGTEDIHELYFIRGSFYEQLIRLFGRKNIAFSKYKKHIYSAHPNFEKGILKRNNNEYEWLNLVQIISHEGLHSQMYKDYCKWGMMQTPSWINEGYAEYISYQPIRNNHDYQLSDLLDKLEGNNESWLKTEHGAMTPRLYMRDRLLMEYLIDVKGMNILEIIADKTLQPEGIYQEVKEYLGSE